MVLPDRVHQVGECVMDSRSDDTESLGVGSPKHDYLVNLASLLELSDVFPNKLQIFHLPPADHNVVGSLILVLGYKVRVVD